MLKVLNSCNFMVFGARNLQTYKFLDADVEWSAEVVGFGYFCHNLSSSKGPDLPPQAVSSDGVTAELLFLVCFLNSPGMTVDNMGASVCLSPGKTFVPVISQNLFFSYIGHMLKIVTSKGSVPSSECSSGALIRTYACCYSSLLSVEFSLNGCGIGANNFFFKFY